MSTNFTNILFGLIWLMKSTVFVKQIRFKQYLLCDRPELIVLVSHINASTFEQQKAHVSGIIFNTIDVLGGY